MNEDIIEGKWTEIKGKIKKQWGKLTDDEVSEINGSYDELCGKLQKKYGYQKDRAEKEIGNFIRENNWLDD